MRLFTRFGDRLLAAVLPTATAEAACAPNEQSWYECGPGRLRYHHYCYTKTLSGGQCKRVCTVTPSGYCD